MDTHIHVRVMVRQFLLISLSPFPQESVGVQTESFAGLRSSNGVHH